jgi:hypothetical protein
MKMNKTVSALIAGATLTLGACSFVEIRPEAEDILVLDKGRVADCERLGRTRVSVAPAVGFIKRSEDAVREDLKVLARNSAAEMGGDTVNAETQVNDGKQTFAIYDCVRSEDSNGDS